jgi:hypothetical protein
VLPPVLDAAVEFWSVTLLTPSIRRRRSSVSATDAWFTAQPVIVKLGTLPGGVVDATAPPLLAPALGVAAAPGLLPAALLLELLLELLLALGLEAEPEAADPPAGVIAPDTDVIETTGGSTRPSSWTVCAQSKRESTSCETA